MDQLTAYRILHLMPGSTRKEIRQAYARLAKEYHPEEHPKEFNQIQEAYQLLTGRGDGENWSSDAGDDWFSKGEETEPDREPEEQWEFYTQDFGHITAWEFLRSGLPGSCSGCHFLE